MPTGSAHRRQRQEQENRVAAHYGRPPRPFQGDESGVENIMKYLSLCSGIGGIERAADLVNEKE